jgi:dihydrofolate reductase
VVLGFAHLRVRADTLIFARRSAWCWGRSSADIPEARLRGCGCGLMGHHVAVRTLTYYIGSTVDGFIAGPDGEVDFFPVRDDVMQHIAAEYPETVPTHIRAALGIDPPNRLFDTVVMGRATYEPALKSGITSPYAHLRQYVASRSMPSPDPAVTVVDDPVAVVRHLKQQPGAGIWLAGGAKLAAALLPEIDQLIVKVYPVLAGVGVPLFDGGFTPTPLRLTGRVLLDSGAAIMTYDRAPAA